MSDTNREAILTALHKDRPWRPDSENEYLINVMAQEGVPFCFDCSDWHHPNEVHTQKEN